MMLDLPFAFLLSVPRTVALPRSSLGGNSGLGGDEFLRRLCAFAVAHLACISLFVWRGGLRARNASKWALLYVPLAVIVPAAVLPLAGSASIAVAVPALLILAMAVWKGTGNRAVALGTCHYSIPFFQ
ncbi:lysoplasmalogenase family protein [Paeniglutamicibacter kerguelensis]|uniref:Uncharacterized protein n=1 Tax=Paeniglutamicibacter kerguelensis TaxID=254788 RepID=A0ABS4XFD5_9MICC|nr:lysoplasmalogenase family protein [Paeniglutamicibacter kerguelensis]MBP2386409.1 hypothetical protein [Paeniglutamicibacter kerguelensis]